MTTAFQERFRKKFLPRTDLRIPFYDLRECITPLGRLYYDDQHVYPSVTTVLGATKSEESVAALEAWKARTPQVEQDSYAIRGTALHEAVEAFLKNEVPKPNPRLTQIQNILNPIQNIVAQEARVCTRGLDWEYQVAGRFDCLAEYNGVLSIIDFKTAKSEKRAEWIEDYFIQTSIYAHLVADILGVPLPQSVILIVTDNGASQRFIEDSNKYWPKAEERFSMFYKKWSEKDLHDELVEHYAPLNQRTT